jgi:hypothetical protein
MVLRFIPYIGAPISLLFPLVLTLAADAGWTMPLYTVAAFALIEIVCAYALEPHLFGSSTGLSRVALIVATAFWTVLWGPIGLLLAAPLTACLVVVGRYVPQLQFLEVLLGNTQALSPELKVYQRLLAGDPGEAADVAEEHLERHGLVRTWDAVLLPALALAAQDRGRGVLARDRLEEMVTDLRELADDLLTDAPPPGPSTATAALCLGAGSRLDDAAAGIVTLALRAGGVPADSPAAAPGARRRLGDLPATGPAAVLVIAVGPGAAGRARRLVRRLRERYGAAMPVVIALWRLEEDAGGVLLEREKVVTRVEDAIAALGQRPPAAAPVDHGEPASPLAGPAPTPSAAV